MHDFPHIPTVFVGTAEELLEFLQTGRRPGEPPALPHLQAAQEYLAEAILRLGAALKLEDPEEESVNFDRVRRAGRQALRAAVALIECVNPATEELRELQHGSLEAVGKVAEALGFSQDGVARQTERIPWNGENTFITHTPTGTRIRIEMAGKHLLIRGQADPHAQVSFDYRTISPHDEF